MENIKLTQLIREGIAEYIREIDEAGDIAALEAKMTKTQEAIDNRKKKINMEGLDEDMKSMIDEKKVKELGSEIKSLEKSLTKYQKQLDKLKSKSAAAPATETEEEKEIVDENAVEEIESTNEDAVIDESDIKLEEEVTEEPLNEQFQYMQKLAGIKPKLITENKK